MSPQSKQEYREAIYLRYKRASRHEKTLILDEFCATCRCHRKHAIRVLRRFKRFTRPKPRKRGKPSRYQREEILTPLKQIWLEANLPCSKRLQAILPLWLPGYAQCFGELPSDVNHDLQAISPATIDRLLRPIRVQYQGRGRSTTKPGTLLKNQIPIQTNQWDESRPGFLEADTVAHCGESLSGSFVYTIDTVDIATGWTEQRAVWGKGESAVLDQLIDIEKALPFPLLGFDSDNGSEFLNYHLLRHFTHRKQPVRFTRSRPYHKDDNAHIEQKNWTHVRQWLGYRRLDKPSIVPILNDLYQREWRTFHNFFCPSVKLINKKRIGSKTIKQYDSPKTPYQRAFESPYLSQKVKDDMTNYLEKQNPFLLRKSIEAKLKTIFGLIASG
ncbi:MAG: transposase [Deltaproteobacteria bacterium]|nr:transposase [Deltaproteobacteria bacterium]